MTVIELKTMDERAQDAVREAGYGLLTSRRSGRRRYMIISPETGGAVAGWPTGPDNRDYSFTAEDVIDWCTDRDGPISITKKEGGEYTLYHPMLTIVPERWRGDQRPGGKRKAKRPS
jgi:hypothetical protein